MAVRNAPCDPAEMLMSHYSAVEASAQRMLEQAEVGLWPQVAALARRIGALTAQLDELAARTRLSPAQDEERVRVLARIVAIDARIRHLREPWTARLDQLLSPRPARAIDPLSGLGLRASDGN